MIKTLNVKQESCGGINVPSGKLTHLLLMITAGQSVRTAAETSGAGLFVNFFSAKVFSPLLEKCRFFVIHLLCGFNFGSDGCA